MTDIRAENQDQRPVGSDRSVETDGQTDRRTVPIAIRLANVVSDVDEYG